MKKSELRQLIREEQYQLDTGKTSDIKKAHAQYVELVKKHNLILRQLNDIERYLGLPTTK